MSAYLSQILKLSVSERLLLVEAIWDSIVDEKENKSDYNLSQEQIKFLEEEIENYSKNPSEGGTWQEIKNRIKGKKWLFGSLFKKGLKHKF